jgi:2-dehydro-3-deoxygalactonokinase
MEGRPMSFIACDWGTSRLRLRWRGPDGGCRETASDEGAARLAALGGDRAEAFAGALRRGLGRLGAPEGLPVVVSGMAGSSIGWRELPYARLPFALDGSGVLSEQVLPGVHLVSGVRGVSDMMRGEETQALGWAEQSGAALPAMATLVLPGTHSKHLRVESGAVTAIATFLTGELFEVLGRHSVLRHSIDAEADRQADSGDGDAGAFDEGVASSGRMALGAALFQVRVRQVLHGRPPAANRAFLSGLLIGAELRALPGDDTPIVLAAGSSLRESYSRAAAGCGLGPRWSAIEVDDLCELGQRRLWRRWSGG